MARISDMIRPLVLSGAVLVVWAVASHGFGLPPYLIPPPDAVLKQLIAQAPRLLEEGAITATAAIAGFGLSILVGIPIAMLIAYSRAIERYLYPLLVFSQSVPKIAVAPLFVVWFGFGILPKIISAFLLGVFPVIVATVTGFKSIERDMTDLARSSCAGPLRTFWYIALPFSLPYVFSGLKISITFAVVGAVVGEFVGSNSGIGYVLQIANGNFDLPLMFAALIVLSLIGVLLYAMVDLAERLLIPWHASQRSELQMGS